MRDVYVAGTGITDFGKFLDRSLRSLAEEATAAALSDAGTQAEAVDVVYFSNAVAGLITGQETIRGESALRESGLLGRPIVNVDNACAGGSTAFHLARLSVAAGEADLALAVGAEKLVHEDKAKTFAAFSSGVDQELLQNGNGVLGASAGGGATQSVFMDVYASLARNYMDRSGANVEQLAKVAVKAHEHGALNPRAQYRDHVTVEQVLESREISAPLTMLMCSPVADGAAALLLASEDGLARLEAADPVKVLASVLLTSLPDRDWDELSVIEIAALRAYDLAGLGPEDLDVVELHDAATPAELTVPEELGLCPRDGGGLELLESGATRIGGSIPINPGGGLLSRGHPVGATGCAQLVELTDQLRGRCGERQVQGAEVALSENGGGWTGSPKADPAAATITILGKAG